MNFSPTGRQNPEPRPEIGFQPYLSVMAEAVCGNVDYRQWRRDLEAMEHVLRVSGLEDSTVAAALQRHERLLHRRLSPKHRQRFCQQAHQAIRCAVARRLKGVSLRDFGVLLAESFLLQWFCGVSRLAQKVCVPGKSTLQRWDALFVETEIRDLVVGLNRMAFDATGSETLGLAWPLSTDEVFMDTTCARANIHFPVDWLLLRDAVRSLTAATECIRRHGLKHRMPQPKQFACDMNRLVMAMTFSSRNNNRVQKKRCLRHMIELSHKVEAHARRHLQILKTRRDESDLSEGQAAAIDRRINSILQQLPAATAQARERILLGQQTANTEKKLSLYEPDAHVLLRGKAGVQVEFGNTLRLTEQREGLIVEWFLHRRIAPADSRQVIDCMKNLQTRYGDNAVTALATDRGMHSAANSEWLASQGIYNAICPRDPRVLTQRRKRELRFVQLQNRRAQTEGRVGIIKNDFIGNPTRTKGYTRQAQDVAWSVLTHNLRLLARLASEARASAPMQKTG